MAKRELISEVRRHFGADARVEQRANDTGFANEAFRVDVKGQALWVKVSPSPSENARLDLWATVAQVLEERYWAPPVLEHVTFLDRTALVFPRLAAPRATAETFREHTHQILGALRRLHDDGTLAAAVAQKEVITAEEAFHRLWGRRLREDLEIISGHVPFVSDSSLAWMEEELDHVLDLTSSPEFQSHVQSPVHGDLWANNVLVQSDRLYLLDWDDLSISDAVIDIAIVLFHAYGPNVEAWAPQWSGLSDEREQARLQLALRAQSLDAVIDPLADWVEAAAVPKNLSFVRRLKASQHQAALVQYRGLYG